MVHQEVCRVSTLPTPLSPGSVHPSDSLSWQCAAYEAPRHGSVSPSTGVRAGARVHISCDDGYKPLTIAMTDFGSDKAFGDVSTRIPEA